MGEPWKKWLKKNLVWKRHFTLTISIFVSELVLDVDRDDETDSGTGMLLVVVGRGVGAWGVTGCCSNKTMTGEEEDEFTICCCDWSCSTAGTNRFWLDNEVTAESDCVRRVFSPRIIALGLFSRLTTIGSCFIWGWSIDCGGRIGAGVIFCRLEASAKSAAINPSHEIRNE